MSEHNNHHTLVALEDVLGALVEGGPLSGEELAQRLSLTRLDARMVLVDAHAHGLVETNNRGQWEIAEPGREALASTGRQPQRGRPAWQARLRPAWQARLRPAWQARLRPAYLGRRGVPIALALIVSAAGGVAVANSGLPSFSGPPVVNSTNAKAPRHARHRRAARRGYRVYYSSVARHRYVPRTRMVGTVRLTRRLPVRRPYESRRPVSAPCQQRLGGARTAGRRPRRPAATAATSIGKRTATTGLGDHATSGGRRPITAPQPARCAR